MYKLPDGDNNLYDKFITHLTKEELAMGFHIIESELERRTFALQLYLSGAAIPTSELGGLEFEMDMGVDDWVIGLTTYKKLAFTVANDSTDIEDGTKTGQTVKPVIQLKVNDSQNSNGRYINVPYGTYIVDSVAKDMTLKNYSCYDQLYYINDIDCDFGGETYPTTVGHVLETITSKYAAKGIIPLTDSHQGDFEPWWNDVLGQPKKYKDYEPTEKEEEDELLPEPIDPVEDNFPQDEGIDPEPNPGKCCDCPPCGDGGTGSNVGLIIIPSEAEIEIDEQLQMTYKLDLNGVEDDAQVYWDISDPNVASIDQDGLVIGLKKGKVIVMCSLVSDPKINDTAIVKVGSAGEGVSIVLNDRVELFTGTKHYWNDEGDFANNEIPRLPVLWCRVEPYDTDSLEWTTRYSDELRKFNEEYSAFDPGFEVRWTSSDVDILEFTKGDKWDSGQRCPEILVKDSGTVTIKVEVRKADNLFSDHIPDDYYGIATLTLKIPESTSNSLMKKYWNNERPDPSIVKDWDFTNVNGGGFYSGCKCINKQTGYIKFNHSGTAVSYSTYLEVPNNTSMWFYWGGNMNQPAIRLLPTEPFNTKYAVFRITKMDERLRPYFMGMGFRAHFNEVYPKKGDQVFYEGYSTNTQYTTKYTLPYDAKDVYCGDYWYTFDNEILEEIAIPNFFLSSESYRVNFQFFRDNEYGRLVATCIDFSKLLNENRDLYDAFMDDSTKVIEYEIEYFADAELTEEDYRYLTFANGLYFNTPDSSNRPFLGNTKYLFDYGKKNSSDGLVGGNFTSNTHGVFYQVGTNVKNWWPEEVNYQLEKSTVDSDTYLKRLPLTQNGKISKIEDSVWYKTSALVGDGYVSGDFTPLNPDPNGIKRIKSDSSKSISEAQNTQTYSLMSRTRNILAASYDEDGNLIATYAEETDTNDPSLTPNENGQVLVTTPEEIGFEMTEGQLLGYIAAYCGGNIALDHEGEMRLLRLVDSQTEDGGVGYDKRIPNNQVAVPEIDNCEASSQLGGLIVHTSTYEGDDIKIGSEKPTDTRYVIEIDNPFMTEERAQEIYDEMSQCIYFPMRAVILSDPRLWLGDMLYFDGYSQLNEASGVTVEVVREGYYPIMKLVSHYDGAPSLEIEATCSNYSDRSNSFTGTLNDKIDEVSAKANETNKAVNELKTDFEEIRVLVGYINELFAIEVNADNIVSATINTRNIRIAPSKGKDNGGVYIDGDSIDFIDNDGIQRLHLGTNGTEHNDYYIKFLNSDGYTRELRALTPDGTECGSSNSGDEITLLSSRNISLESLEARIAELEAKLNESEGE